MLLRTGSLGGARYALTDRAGGVSAPPYDTLNLGDHVGDDPAAVAENRARLLAALPGARRLAFMRQVHGAAVAHVDDHHGAGPASSADALTREGSSPEADALVATAPGVAVVVLSADCVPVLLAATDRPLVAAVHAGRLGVARGVVPAAVDALVAQGVAPGALAALVGPAVCGRCYEVPEAMRDEVSALVPEARSVTAAGTPALDLPAAVAAQLARAGVRDVTRAPECPVEETALFSHRRDAVTGRIAAAVWVPVP